MKTKYFFVFIAQLFYPVSEDVRLNTTYFSIMKIPKRWELQQIIINYSCDTGFNQFKKIYRKTSKNYWRIGKREGGGGDNLKQYSHISAMYQIIKIYARLKETAEIQNSTKLSNLNYSASGNN